MGVVPVKLKAMPVWVLLLLATTSLIVLMGDGVSARKLVSIEESIREDPDLSEVDIMRMTTKKSDLLLVLDHLQYFNVCALNVTLNCLNPS